MAKNLDSRELSDEELENVRGGVPHLHFLPVNPNEETKMKEEVVTATSHATKKVN
jgi:hypothetical protein